MESIARFVSSFFIRIGMSDGVQRATGGEAAGVNVSHSFSYFNMLQALVFN